MKRSVRMILTAILASCILAFLTGCALIGSKGGKEKASDDNRCDVYYLEPDRLTLTTRSFTPQSEHFDGILNELLDVFVSPEAAGVVSALPDGIAINGYMMGVDNLTVDFNAAYLGLTNIQKALLDAALVKTLVKLPGVVSISLTADGQPIRYDDGTALTMLNADSFLEVQGEGLASYRFTTMNLYFASGDGSVIAREIRDGSYSSNMTMEQAVAEEIISGPKEEGHRAVVSPQARVNSISISNGLCRLDMNEAFNQPPDQEVTPEACVYAFVNSICETGSVYRVEFTIEGKTDVRLWGKLSLEQTFSREPGIIEKLETEPQT